MGEYEQDVSTKQVDVVSPKLNPGAPAAEPSWRVRHSAWLLAPVFGCGLLSFVGFVYCAIRVRQPKWTVVAAISVALTILGWILASTWTNADGDLSTGATVYIVELWLASILFALVINRDYLEWRAGEFAGAATDTATQQQQGVSDPTQATRVPPTASPRQTQGPTWPEDPGMYIDPWDLSVLRYWDGSNWTAKTVPRPR
jgi:hypothetical protein